MSRAIPLLCNRVAETSVPLRQQSSGASSLLPTGYLMRLRLQLPSNECKENSSAPPKGVDPKLIPQVENVVFIGNTRYHGSTAQTMPEAVPPDLAGTRCWHCLCNVLQLKFV